jgi:predicted ferric reductase
MNTRDDSRVSTLWYLTRSTGIVAAILAAGSIVWGTRFSARATGARLRPNWWLDLHNWLGGLALCFTTAHVLFAIIDDTSGIDLLDAVVPGHARVGSAAVSWGVIAFDVFVIVVFTSWPRKRFGRRTWRVVHLISLPAMILVGLHTFRLGSDSSTVALRLTAVALTGLMLYPLGLRVSGLRRR